MDDCYLFNNKKDYLKLSDEDNQRIKLLRIPPNWTNVKISKDSISKVQVTGKDSRGRTQYIYHPVWTLFSKDSKYSKMNSINFNAFDSIFKKYSSFNNTYNKNYIISNMFILMKDLNIRVGNEKYLEENDSVGLCTLQKTHYKKEKIKNNSSDIVHKFVFKGKRGVLHEKILKLEHITFIENIIKIQGKSLFKYLDENTKPPSYKKIQADDLNQFVKIYIDKNISCKDIRTYCANQIFKREYSRLIKNGTQLKKARIEAIKITANELGNTPKVCRDSYIDPSLYM